MKKLLPDVMSILVASLALTSSLPAYAGWEQVHSLPTNYAHFVTSEGVHLMSDYRDNRDGGIYYSTDKGETWTKSEVKDYWYSNFYEADGYVFAIGSSCRIARSEDGGRTWDLLNYARAVEGWVPEKAIDETVCYGITVLDGVLYAGDFSGGGVISSPDYGETWEMTDRESLYIRFQGDDRDIMDNVYHLEAFKGKVYAFGMYSVHSYSPADGLWTALPVNSNFMGAVTVMGDRMICGRAVPNYGTDVEYLMVTDGEKWEDMPRPDTDDNNVRALGNDGKYLFSMHHGGPMYYSDDMGASWNVASGLPDGLYPLTVDCDDDYVYAALYSPVPSEKRSGLWRIAKSELAHSEVECVGIGGEHDIHVVGDRLVCVGAEEIAVFASSGECVIMWKNVGGVDLASLPEGVYVYRVIREGVSHMGKFVR